MLIPVVRRYASTDPTLMRWKLADLNFTNVHGAAAAVRHFLALSGTFWPDFRHFDCSELDVHVRTYAQGAASSCLRLNLADVVLI